VSALLTALAGIAALTIALRGWLRERASHDWPVAHARVVEHRIHDLSGTSSGMRVQVELLVDYDFRGERLRALLPPSPSHRVHYSADGALSYAAEHNPIGSSLTIRVDPADHVNIIVPGATQVRDIIAALVGALLAGASLMGLWRS
jgi:hypothetical protein